MRGFTSSCSQRTCRLPCSLLPACVRCTQESLCFRSGASSRDHEEWVASGCCPPQKQDTREKERVRKRVCMCVCGRGRWTEQEETARKACQATRKNFKDELQEFYSRCQSPCNLAGQSLPLNVHAANAAEGRRMDCLVISVLRTREKQLGNLVWRVQHGLGHLHGEDCFSSLPCLAGRKNKERERESRGSGGDEPKLNRRGPEPHIVRKNCCHVWIGNLEKTLPEILQRLCLQGPRRASRGETKEFSLAAEAIGRLGRSAPRISL